MKQLQIGKLYRMISDEGCDELRLMAEINGLRAFARICYNDLFVALEQSDEPTPNFNAMWVKVASPKHGIGWVLIWRNMREIELV